MELHPLRPDYTGLLGDRRLEKRGHSFLVTWSVGAVPASGRAFLTALPRKGATGF
jgi:hypothetical protein